MINHKRLWEAVLLTAINDALYSGKNKERIKYREKALEWFSSDNKDFKLVCELAELNHEYVLNNYNKEKLAI